MAPSSVTKPVVVDPFANGVAPGPSIFFAPPTYIDSGFPAPGGIPVKPPLGFFNWLFNYCTNAVRYFSALGLPDWDILETEYAAGSMVRDLNDGRIYRLVGTATTGTAPHADLTNWEMWIRSPFAGSGSHVATPEPTQQWYDDRRVPRFGLDDRGLPAGQWSGWTETWTPGTQYGLSGAQNTQVGRWKIHSTGSLSQLATFAPGHSVLSAPSDTAASLGLTLDGTTGSIHGVRLALDSATSQFTPSTMVEVEFDIAVDSLTSATDWVVGLTCADVDQDINAITAGVFFIWANSSGPNWRCQTINGGSPTDTDSGVAANTNTNYHLKIVLVGSGIGADGTSRAWFYVNGVLRAITSTTLPLAGGIVTTPIQPCFGGFTNSNTGQHSMQIGPVRYRQIDATVGYL